MDSPAARRPRTDSPRPAPRPAAGPAVRATPAVYRRRRVVAGALTLAVAWAGVGLGTGVVGRMTGTTGGLDPAGASGPTVAYVVQPGDTWWDLAERVDPEADRRAVVDRLQDMNGGGALQAGQRIELPA